MSRKFLVIALLIFASSVVAQIELPNNSVRFESNSPSSGNSRGLEFPEIKAPSLSNNKNPNTPNNSNLGIEKAESFDMQKGDGLVEYKGSNKAPKYFTKDKEAKAEYGRDMYLGDIKTNSKYVTLEYRDHEYVDGDRVRIYVNGEIFISNVMLEGSFRGFNLPLVDGFNRIEFEALNQGSSGPNTAQLRITDEIGNVLALYEWNLLTGNKATAIVVKP